MTYTNVLDKKFEEQFDGVVAVIYELEARRDNVCKQETDKNTLNKKWKLGNT